MLVMEFTGNDKHLVRKYLIHQPMFIGNAAGPAAGSVALERLWLSRAVVGVARYLNDELVDLPIDFFVFFFPLAELIKCVVFKTNHRFAARSFTACSTSSMELKLIILPSAMFFIALSK